MGLESGTIVERYCGSDRNWLLLRTNLRSLGFVVLGADGTVFQHSV